MRQGRRQASLGQSLTWFAGSYGLAILGYLVTNAVASRWLGTREFGLFVVVLTVSTIVGQLGLLGAHRGGLREAATMREGDVESLRILRRGARAVIVLTLPVAAVASGAVVWATTDGDLVTRVVTAVGFAVLVALSGLQKLWANYLRGFGQVRFAGFLEGRSGGALVSCLQAAALGLAWWLVPESGLAGATAALALGFALPVLLAGRRVRRRWSHVPAEGSLLHDVRDMTRRNWRFAVNQFAVYLSSTVEIWIAAAVLIAVDASYFSAAQRMALLISIAPTSLQVVFSPVAARMLDRGDRGRLQAVLRTGATLSSLASALFIVPMVVAPALLLEIAFGEAFRGAALTLVILAAANVFNALSGLAGTALTMSRQEGVIALVQAVSVTLRVVLGVAAALLWGLLGLAVTAAVITALTYTVIWALARRRLGLRTEPTLRPRIGLLRSTRG